MSIRDEEFKRLLLYAKGLGLKVTVYNKPNKHAMAEWIMDGSEIKIYASGQTSKTELVLTLCHELGHHLEYVHSKKRKISNKLDTAWGRENGRKAGEILPESTRKLIYQDEAAGIRYWDVIIKDVHIKISKWKVELRKEFDLWVYEYFWKNGEYPTRPECRTKTKELRAKWKT